MKKQQKCYIYTRVSTSMQVEGYSLDAQKGLRIQKYNPLMSIGRKMRKLRNGEKV